MEKWNIEFRSLLESLVGAPYGTAPFWITAAIALTCLLILGWLVTSIVFQAKRGFVLTFIANLGPAVAAAAAWVAVTLYAVPEINAGVVRDYLPLAAAILGAFLATMLFTRFLLGISELSTILAVILTYICVGASVFFAGTIAGEVDTSLENIEEKTREKELEAGSILNY